MARRTALTKDRPESPPWWRTHTPAIDMTLLTRVLTGLKRIPLDPPAGEPQPGPEPAAGPPGTAALTAVRTSFAALAAAGDRGPACFYATLFASCPHLRELFPPAMDEQRDRLLRALQQIVDTIATPEEFAAYLGKLGRTHRKYAVTPDMYEPVGAALIAAVRQHAGDAFTAEAQEAWLQVYRAVSAMMIRAAAEDPAPAYWTGEVAGHVYHGNGVAVLTVAPDAGLPYRAGQHVTLQTPRWPKVWAALLGG